MKETELAQKFVTYYSSYDLYFEVDYAGHSIDIVGLVNNISISIEVKTTFNFKVLEQALQNKPYFNYSYIAVPSFKYPYFQEQLCTDYGIGLLVYERKYNVDHIYELVKPKLNRLTNDKLKSRLNNNSKRSIPGSPSGAGKVTAFKVTVENMVNYVERYPGCKLKDMISKISHHYNTDKAAISCTYTWLRQGVIKEIRLENGKLYLNK